MTRSILAGQERESERENYLRGEAKVGESRGDEEKEKASGRAQS